MNAKKVIIEKVDASTVRFVSPEANTLLLWILASPASDLGTAFPQNLGRGGYGPKHYLQKFHGKYVGEAEANRLAAEKKHNNWVSHIKALMDWKQNPDIPVVSDIFDLSEQIRGDVNNNPQIPFHIPILSDIMKGLGR